MRGTILGAGAVLVTVMLIGVARAQDAPGGAAAPESPAAEQLPDAGLPRATRPTPRPRLSTCSNTACSATPCSPIATSSAPYIRTSEKGSSFADVEAARSALELAYRQAGYGTVFVDLPEQNVDRGIVRLRVTEGRIDRVRIAGAKYYSNRRIRAALPSMVSGAVPKLPEVQAEINAFNKRSADRSIVPVLKAGRTPGTVDISLRVADEHPWHGAVEVNDRYTAQTTKLRASLLLSYDNLWQREHSLSFQYQTAPKDREDVEAMVASYAMPLNRWPDTTLVFYGVDSNTDVAALGDINVLGNGRIYGTRLLHALPARPELTSSVLIGLDYKDFLENIRLVDDDSLVTPVTYLNWSLGYSGSREPRTRDHQLWADRQFRRAPRGQRHLRVPRQTLQRAC